MSDIKDGQGQTDPQIKTVLRRRRFLNIGALAAGITALSANTNNDANAAPGDKNQSIAYVPVTEKGVPGGVATLDSNGKIPSQQLPDISLANVRHTSQGGHFPTGTKVDRTAGEKYVIGVDDIRSRYFLLNGSAIWQMRTTGLYDSATFIGKPSDVDFNVAGRAKILYFKGDYYLAIKNGAGLPGVYRGTPRADPAAEFLWSPALQTMREGADIITSAFNASADYLYWGEYGNPKGGPVLYRSADGLKWEAILGPFPTLNHIHSVNADPYQPGHIYASFGDSSSMKHMRSTNHGAPGSWLELPDSSGSSRQAVQISFDEKFVWYASDANLSGWTAFRLNRTTQEWEWASTDWHFTHAVPGGRGGRYVSDLITSFHSTIMTSATANFNDADRGAVIRSKASAVADNTVITSVIDASTIQVSQFALGSATTGATITGDQFYGSAFYGSVDADTGIYYCVSNDASFVGNTAGLFAILPGGELRLLKVLGVNPDTEMYIGAQHGWIGQYQFNLLA